MLRAGSFVLTRWRDWLTDEVLDQLALSERQKKAILLTKNTSLLTNTLYQKITGVARTSAKRDLEELAAKGVLVRIGKGRGVTYSIALKWSRNGPNGPNSQPLPER